MAGGMSPPSLATPPTMPGFGFAHPSPQQPPPPLSHPGIGGGAPPGLKLGDFPFPGGLAAFRKSNSYFILFSAD